MRGNSFANGNSHANGASVSNGPWGQAWQQGWIIRPATIWDHMEPGLPA